MDLKELLAALEIDPIGAGAFQLALDVEPPDTKPRQDASPKVSCLLVTNGARSTMACAIECYRRQTYANRELVIVTHPDGLDAVNAAVAAGGAGDVSVHCVGRELSLGDCRNLAIARSKGAIVMQWDDDDLYDPMRITAAVTLLKSADVAAAMLRRVLVWWPARRLAAISMSRLWEGSIAVWRDHAAVYPSWARGEDTVAVDCIATTRPVASYEATLLYVYIVHAGNTWDEPHFEQVMAQAEHVIEAEHYDELMERLGERMPVERYLSAMASDAAARAGAAAAHV